jgi:hypothetical protein
MSMRIAESSAELSAPLYPPELLYPLGLPEQVIGPADAAVFVAGRGVLNATGLTPAATGRVSGRSEARFSADAPGCCSA